MDAQMTPEAFCWLYAAGCVEWLYQTGKIDEKEYLYLRKFMDGNVTPPKDKIRKYFPKPFKFASTLKEMISYWRKKHLYKEGEITPVMLAEVREYEVIKGGKKFVRVKVFLGKNDFKIHSVENVHQYDIRPGSNVLIHGNIIAELASR